MINPSATSSTCTQSTTVLIKWLTAIDRYARQTILMLRVLLETPRVTL
jgi:hypothetical protein